MRQRYTLLFVLIWASLGSVAPGLAAPVTFNTALAVGKGEVITRLVIGLDEASGGSTNVTRRSVTVVGVYGVTRRIAVFGVVPFGDMRLEMTGPDRTSSGVGDARFFARYALYHHDGPGRTFRIAPYLGFKAPTGDDNERDALGRLPQPLQPGSGSWDAFGGIVASYATTRMNIDGQISYRRNNEAGRFQAGDVTRIDFSAQRRISDTLFGSTEPIYTYVGIEGAAMSVDQARALGATNPNTGGQVLMAGPTLQLAALRWIADVALQVHLAQSMNGSGLEKDFNVRAGLRINF